VGFKPRPGVTAGLVKVPFQGWGERKWYIRVTMRGISFTSTKSWIRTDAEKHLATVKGFVLLDE
jgi:hypothetical protein